MDVFLGFEEDSRIVANWFYGAGDAAKLQHVGHEVGLGRHAFMATGFEAEVAELELFDVFGGLAWREPLKE